MGIESKNPPLPAPTESSIEYQSDLAPTDLATDISRRTDQTSFSIPEDGSPITLSTKKLNIGKGAASEASLLIEFLEVAHSTSSKPSVRVKITPSNKKRSGIGFSLFEQRTQSSELPDLKEQPTSSVRTDSENNFVPYQPHWSTSKIEDSAYSRDVDLVDDRDRSQYLFPTSDISSMPADSMIEGTLVSQITHDRKATSQMSHEQPHMDTLQAPSRPRSRSASKERITQKVLEKLAREQSPEHHASAVKSRKHRSTASSNDNSTGISKLQSRKSSRSHKEDDGFSIAGSSVVNAPDQDSSVSGMSKSSLNPKLLQTVEDVVRRLILPEIETIKRQQSTRESSSNLNSRTRSRSFEQKASDSNLSHTGSISYAKPKVVLTRDKDDPGQILSDYSVRRRQHRRSSKDSTTSKTMDHDRFFGNTIEDREGARKEDRGIVTKTSSNALTAAALDSYNSRSSIDSFERDRRQRRKHRGQGHDRSTSTSVSSHKGTKAFREFSSMPMQSEVADSELTRESILSAETVEAKSSLSGQYDETLPSVHEVPRRSPVNQMSLPPAGSPQSSRSKSDLMATRSDRSLSSKSRKAALMAAGFGAGSSALYGHARRPSRQNDGERKDDSNYKVSNRQSATRMSNERALDHDQTVHGLASNKAKEVPKSFNEAELSSRGEHARPDSRNSERYFEQTPYTELASSHQVDDFRNGQRNDIISPHSDLVSLSKPVESQVASLLDPSTVESLTELSEKVPHEFVQNKADLLEKDSAERWATLRDNAQQRSLDALSAGALESGYHGNEGNHEALGFKDDTHTQGFVATDQFYEERDPSILEGQLGDDEEARGQWPYEPTPPIRSAGSALSFNGPNGNQNIDMSATPSGLGIATISQSKSNISKESFNPTSAPLRGTTPSTLDSHSSRTDPMRSGTERSTAIKGGQGNIPKSQPGHIQDRYGFETHQISQSLAPEARSPYYDSATGTGVNNIQSKDVVALMDHLTVRDGQRNARDTEILVTLVRSAAEMRNSFEEIKRFVEAQNQVNAHRNDLVADRSINRALNGPNGNLTSFHSRGARSSSATEDSPGKRKNIFQRALKGLSGRNTADLNRMEDLLVQILEEVEALRAVNAGTHLPGLSARNLDISGPSMSVPMAVRSPDQAIGTLPSQSKSMEPNLARPQYRQAFDAHGEVHTSNINTGNVLGTLEAHGVSNDDGEWRSLTPTNEARTTVARLDADVSADDEQPRPINTSTFPDLKNTHSRHKSTGSSVFAIPRISRWSKTTTSSVPNTPNYRSQRFSQQTKWSSDIHDDSEDVDMSAEFSSQAHGPVLPGSETGQPDRTASPLIPDSQMSFEEAKYQANRHSLTLQHPQPRQGPNRKQRSLIETQARAYGGISPDTGTMSPQSDAFGSFPALARINRLSGSQDYRPATLSPVSSGADSMKSQNQGADPLIPSKLEGTSLYTHKQTQMEDTYLSDAHSEDFDNNEGQWIEPVPLPRKQSPYSPGGLLAPIEERYSLEQTRSSISATPAQDRLSNPGDRFDTPQQQVRASFGSMESPTSRKITGPRDMPNRTKMSSRERGN